MLIVLGLGLSVVFRIIIGGSSTDHGRWGLGGVGSRTGMIRSSVQGTVVVGRGRGERGRGVLRRKQPGRRCVLTVRGRGL
ncbi:hypothetical protein EDB83DRAFT_2397799, partial [Lactarius deliciosus]